MYSANRSFALGSSVPTEHGTFTATTSPPYCGSPFALQQMLSDLGYYGGPINGNVDKATLKAAADFARSQGVSNLSYITAEFCRLLGSQWDQLTAASALAARPALVARPAPPLRRLPAPSTETEVVYETPPELVPTGWAALTPTTKYAIGAAVALGLGGVVVLVVASKKRKKK